MNTKTFKNTLYEYSMIALGTFLIACAINVFLVPMKLSSGGIGSIGTVLFYLIKIPLWVTNIVLNAFLFVAGYRFLSRKSLFKTAFGIVFLTLFLEITTHMPSYTEDVFIASLAGGIFMGVGVGVVIRHEASTGGSDFAALMLHGSFAHLSVPTIIFIIDCVIIIFSGLIFKSVTVTFYSAIVLLTASKIGDYLLCIGDRAKLIFVISEKVPDISLCITDGFNRGATGIYSKGIYSDKDRLMLFCVLSPREAPKLVKRIKAIDSKAFVVITDAREVLGEGFK